MRDLHVLRYVGSTLWSVLPDKWTEIVPMLVRHAKGDLVSAEAIAARLGDPGAAATRGAIAVVPIRGVIAHRAEMLSESSGGTSAERIGQMLTAVAADESISTIVYDVDSPGGTVPGIQELAAQMFALRGVKKQVAVAHDLMASAAYWLASQADELVAIPSATSLGAIGVFSGHMDLSQHLKQEGVTVTLLSAGKYKTEGTPFEPLSTEAAAAIQAKVDEAYAQFAKDVARGRGVTPAAVRGGYGEGRALSAKAALTAGVIDRIATWDETLARLAGRKGTTAGMRAAGDEPAIQAGPIDEDPDARLRERLERF